MHGSGGGPLINITYIHTAVHTLSLRSLSSALDDLLSVELSVSVDEKYDQSVGQLQGSLCEENVDISTVQRDEVEVGSPA